MDLLKDKVQKEALAILEKNNYNGTVVMSTGSGKSKVAIDAIKKKEFKNILITSPRTNLKENWKKELKKWLNTFKINLIKGDEFFRQTSYLINEVPIIYLENIQIAYKWSDKEIKRFDLIIADEVHLLITEKYGTLIEKAKSFNIPVIGLTATPDDEKEEKRIFYNKHCPILYKYLDSAKDGLINKRKYLVFQHKLSDNFKITIDTKTKSWNVGEAVQYDNLSAQIRKGQQMMAATGSDDWWNDSFNWFYKKQGNYEQKNAARIYLQSIKNRKTFLWNLNSSVYYALQIKEAILKVKSNKVLLFSENINQAQKLSSYNIHSKQKKDTNKKILNTFDTGTIRELSSVRSLTLGLNIKDVNYLIRESYNGSSVNSTQIDGRADRLNVNDISTVIWIVPIGTQSEQWFIKAMKNNTENVEYFTNINELIANL